MLDEIEKSFIECFVVKSKQDRLLFSPLREIDYPMQTEWSCVYDLDDFKVTICTDTVYYHSFTVTPETFNDVHEFIK